MIGPIESIREIPGLYRIIPLVGFRKTPGVSFNFAPMQALKRIDAVDRVIHESGAVSPGPVGDVARPWYMHPWQDDNLLVLQGTRYVDIYTPAHGKIEHFVAGPDSITQRFPDFRRRRNAGLAAKGLSSHPKR